MALHVLGELVGVRVSDQCDILLKPSRMLRITKDLAAGELALIAEGKVVAYPDDEGVGCTECWGREA